MTTRILPRAPLFTKVHGIAEMRRAALLRAHLDDAIVAARGVDHDAALADGERERLFDVDVLARLARHDRRQRVPVIGRADDHRVDVLAIEDAAEVAVVRDPASG